jgi:nicotinamide-nucleotide amidase
MAGKETAAATAAVVTVGDELLIGQTIDGNAAWLGQRLATLGAPVVFGVRAADDDEAITHALGVALERAPLVVVTGGLGPTDDDRTRPAVARALGAELRLDEGLSSDLEARFRAAGIAELPETNRRQCMVPAGGRVLANPLGTAPGLALDARAGVWQGAGRPPEVAGDALVLLLPGPPRELRAVFEAAEPEIHAWFGDALRPVHVRTLYTTGIAESVLAPRVEAALGEAREVDAAFLPGLTGVAVRLSVWGVADAAEAGRRLDGAEARLDDVLGAYRYRAPESGDLGEAVGAALVARKYTVAVAESCTGGLLAKRLTDRAGASAYFLGGVVAYADDAKVTLAAVDAAMIRRHGAVSEPVARALAEGARGAFGANCGVGITGVAGPGGGSDEKPVGTVWYAVAMPDEVHVRRQWFPGDREAVRVRAAQAALGLLLGLLEGR